MKNLFQWMTGMIALVLVAISVPTKQASAQPGVSVSFQTFYDELSPYGQWINDPDYGYVWAPNVGNDFRPYYSNGQWAMTDYGNTWVSGYDWGWAPFHYGRWTHSRYYGWLWIPGDTWGPSWVSWRNGGGNYGWAPLGPNISINISFGSSYYAPNDWWVFVPYGNIYGGGYGNYWRGPGYNNTYINNTVIINNTYNNTYVYGPRRNEVERATGRKVNVYNMRNERTPGRTSIRGNDVNIYRPKVARAERGREAAPREVTRVDPNRSIRKTAPDLTRQQAVSPTRASEGRNVAPVRTERNDINQRDAIQRNSRVNQAPVQRENVQQQRVQREQQVKQQRAVQQRPQREWSRPEPQQQRQAPAPIQRQAPPPVQRQAPPPVQRQAPPPVQRQAPAPVQRQAPPQMQRQAPPQMQQRPMQQPAQRGGGQSPARGR